MSTIEDWLSSVGEDWHPIIRELVADLERLGWDSSIFQIKEKFGELRFYIGAGSDGIFDRIDATTAKSRCTCEVCGASGMLQDDGAGWYKTRCRKHLKD